MYCRIDVEIKLIVFLCHLLVLSSPTLMMHGHTNLKLGKWVNVPKLVFISLTMYPCSEYGKFMTKFVRTVVPRSARINGEKGGRVCRES